MIVVIEVCVCVYEELSQRLKMPSKPRAAIQMQKKREEKRRLKQEKALERKKKKNQGLYPHNCSTQ